MFGGTGDELCMDLFHGCQNAAGARANRNIQVRLRPNPKIDTITIKLTTRGTVAAKATACEEDVGVLSVEEGVQTD